MSDSTTDKAGWLERIERELAAWEAILAMAREIGFDRPGAAGEWSFKDVAAHLNGWREQTVLRLEGAARGEPPLPPPWPADLNDETDEGVEAINQSIFDRYRDRPAEEILAESSEQYRRMQAAVEIMPEDVLVTPGRFEWLGGEPLSAVLGGSFGHLHEEHEPDIRAWLSSGLR